MIACIVLACLHLTAEDYSRAERFLPWNASQYVLNGELTYEWIGSQDRFWYVRQTPQGKQFRIVDAASGASEVAFDHASIARALTIASGKSVDPNNLPFQKIEFTADDRNITFEIDASTWRCALQGPCAAIENQRRSGTLVSPDGKWAAYTDGFNVRIRSQSDDMDRSLTSDGVERLAYGHRSGSNQSMLDIQFGGAGTLPLPPVALWSPDSRHLLVERLDERGVLDLPYVQHVPGNGEVRPKLFRYPTALPGDSVKPTAQLVVIDVMTGEHTPMQYPPLPVLDETPIESGAVWWSDDGTRIFIVTQEEGKKRQRLLELTAASGRVREVITETSDTYVNTGVSLTDSPDQARGGVWSVGEDILWPSERSDWAHLYRYDRNGKLLRQLTSGAWRVREIVKVDARAGRIYFTAGGRIEGRDPYQRYLYSVGFDGHGLRLLTPEDADHELTRTSFSPSGKYFLSTHSRPDLPPRTVLRTSGGKLVSLIEEANIDRLRADGLRMPEPFTVLAADGKTKLYGNLFRPSRFDPSRSYPVVEMLYPGPQMLMSKKTFLGAMFSRGRPLSSQSLAELGFILVSIDGRGGPLRSKSFHDLSYGRMQAAGELEDHIAAIRQLAQRYPYMDLDRVGIYGTSNGGYGAVRAILAYPDFYKVAVSANGDHDKRGIVPAWGPTYQGPYPGPAWELQSNLPLAANLKGKLLLAVGDMDDNVHPAHSMQLIDALIKANKDFDLLVIPNGRHEIDATSPYFIRRRWDYFVRHLLGAEPPGDYAITR